jgi:Meckel syndrome type 1 protein
LKQILKNVDFLSSFKPEKTADPAYSEPAKEAAPAVAPVVAEVVVTPVAEAATTYTATVYRVSRSVATGYTGRASCVLNICVPEAVSAEVISVEVGVAGATATAAAAASTSSAVLATPAVVKRSPVGVVAAAGAATSAVVAPVLELNTAAVTGYSGGATCVNNVCVPEPISVEVLSAEVGVGASATATATAAPAAAVKRSDVAPVAVSAALYY